MDEIKNGVSSVAYRTPYYYKWVRESLQKIANQGFEKIGEWITLKVNGSNIIKGKATIIG